MNLNIEVLKEILSALLTKLGGSCTVCRLGEAYVNNFKKRIDLKVRKIQKKTSKFIYIFSFGKKYGFKKFTGLLRNFPDVFKVYQKDAGLFVELIPEEILR